MKPLPRNGEVIITIKDGIGQSWREVRHGRWIEADDFYESGVCSECGRNSGELHGVCVKEWHYCPNCGSRMDLEGDTE